MTPAAATPSLRRRVFDVVEGVGQKAVLPQWFAAGLVVGVVVYVASSIFETVPSLLA